MKVKSQNQAQEPSCHTLPPAASIFHESEYATDEECQSDHENFDNDKCKDTNRLYCKSEDRTYAKGRVYDDTTQIRQRKYIKGELIETRRKNVSDVIIGIINCIIDQI